MPSLDELATETFQHISSYLSYFDQKSLSFASKLSRAVLGHIACPDQLSWIIHSCIALRDFPSCGIIPPSYTIIEAKLDELDKTFARYYGSFGLKWFPQTEEEDRHWDLMQAHYRESAKKRQELPDEDSDEESDEEMDDEQDDEQEDDDDDDEEDEDEEDDDPATAPAPNPQPTYNIGSDFLRDYFGHRKPPFRILGYFYYETLKNHSWAALHDTTVYAYETKYEHEERLNRWWLCHMRCEKRCAKMLLYEYDVTLDHGVVHKDGGVVAGVKKDSLVEAYQVKKRTKTRFMDLF